MGMGQALGIMGVLGKADFLVSFRGLLRSPRQRGPLQPHHPKQVFYLRLYFPPCCPVLSCLKAEAEGTQAEDTAAHTHNAELLGSNSFQRESVFARRAIICAYSLFLLLQCKLQEGGTFSPQYLSPSCPEHWAQSTCPANIF